MQFKNFGKTFQLVINNGNDLKDALTLDEALWGATSAPVPFFHLEPAMEAILDPAKTGRVNSNAIKELIRWFLDKVKNPADIKPDFNGTLPLDGLNETSAAKLIASAKYILDELAAPDKNTISIEQIRAFLTNVAQRPFNGDGVITPEGAAILGDDFKALVDDAIAATGGTADISGKQGVAEKDIASFIAAAKDYLAWLDEGALPEGQTTSAILPMGAETGALAALVSSIDPQVSQFFKLSGLQKFDERIQPRSMGTDAKVNAFDPANVADIDAYLQALPIAKPTLTSTLTLDLNDINPVYRNTWNDVAKKVLIPVLGNLVTEITPEQWQKVKATFEPYAKYQAGKKGAIVEKIAVDKLRGYIADDTIAAKTADAAARDKNVADISAAAREVEKLLLCETYLLRLVNNFISFSELYDIKKHAMFECGSLVIDGRWFKLAFPVDNIAAHQALAKQSLLCVVYIEVTKAPGATFNAVVPITSGTIGNLAVGKRGVFFSLDGKEYDAKITSLISNPVCVQEALLAPFAKIKSIFEGKIEAWSNNAEKTFTTNFDKAISSPDMLKQTAAPKPVKKDDKQGMLLGASVAVAALGSAFAFISQTLSQMSFMAITITIICALFALLAPISVVAIMKLRKQDLSALLEGCGCAINLRMKLTSKLRTQFTSFGKYPKNAEGSPRNYFLLRAIVTAIILALVIGGSCAYRCHRDCMIKKAAEQKAAIEQAKKDAAATPAVAPAAETPATTAPAEVPAAK